MTLPLFTTWLEETRKLQVEVYKADYNRFDFDSTASPEKIQALVAYLDWQIMASFHELAEGHDETSWKPWQHDKPYVNRDAFVREMVDVLHFIANALCAVEVAEDELNQVYSEKMQVNRNRQLQPGGYRIREPGVKCRLCRRALDDVRPALMDPTICMDCAIQEALQSA